MKKLTLLSLLFIILFCNLSFAQQKPKEYIVFSRLTDGFWQIWLKDLDSYEETRLTETPVDKHNPIWLANRGVLVYGTTNDEFYMLTLEGEEKGRILKDFGYVSDLCWLPKSKRLIFAKFRTSFMDASDIWSSRLDGSDRRILTTLAGLQSTPDVSPDEKTIVFTSGKGYGTFEIYKMDSDGQNIARLTENKFMEIYPRISPDGRTLAYASDKSGNYDIWLSDLDGKNQVQLTRDRSFDTYPAWSPDGKKIAFVSTRTGKLQIFIMNLATKAVEQLTVADAESRGPIWIKK
jgi:TolB protein